MWSGNDQLFKPIINKLKEIFLISHENDDTFTYIGIHTTQKPDASIVIDQSSYVEAITAISTNQ